MANHFIDRSLTYNRWSRDYLERLRIESGDTIEIAMNDASDAQVHPDMTVEEYKAIDRLKIHALTGPIGIEGAKPGDQLKIEILEYEHEGWAWTSIVPGLGLLDYEFDEPYLHIWKLEGDQTHSMPGLTLDLNPFCGIIGVQREESGEFATRPPGPFGGNMDVKHLVAGSTLYLPVFVDGAGLCAGDCHAAQGDGEVCINGMEAPMTATFKVSLIKDKPLAGPYITTPGQLVSPRYAKKPFHAFVESDENPREACKRVVRRAMAYLMDRLGLSREQAYVTCSVVLDLKVSQLVNVPTTTITGYLPEAIFD
ncbi:acetamidase/formamidase family protein [Pelagicoccus sp. SDUM812002]|uniref:acetamidase/formamidase family protein n=1 Tax=Pelagicoccus sp. SDUM812002 TaxID=3041266 RepID=UPI00280D7FB6|nr:acetamidase/formamidase family protein [Pelagicoccus sp. SDUM812002]MDQ8187782.1 acetamidase/formamidase family protein [Pelagicoccus sp. SDUM812002]